jgi:hypothetical protein
VNLTLTGFSGRTVRTKESKKKLSTAIERGHKTVSKMKKKIFIAIAVSLYLMPFGATAQDESPNVSPVTLQQKKDAPARESTSTDRQKYRHRLLIGASYGYDFPLKSVDGGEWDRPKDGYSIYLNYLFLPHIGVTADIRPGRYTGWFIGPMYSTVIDKRGLFEFDFKPRIGKVDADMKFDIGTSVRVNFSKHFSFSGNIDFFPNSIDATDYIWNGEIVSQEKSSIINLSAGIVYRPNHAVTVRKSDAADEWLYRSKTNRFGIKAGVNFASITECTIKSGTNRITVDGGSTTAFHVGLFDNYSFTDLLGIQVEGLFSMQGNGRNKLSYIHLPVLLDVRAARNFSFLVGPQIGVNVSKPETFDDRYELRLSTDGISFEELNRISGTNETNAVDFAVVFGAQYTFGKHLVAGARYNLGLTPVRKFDGRNITTSGYNNRVFQLSLGWLF